MTSEAGSSRLESSQSKRKLCVTVNVLGEPKVGKSSIIQRFTKGVFEKTVVDKKHMTHTINEDNMAIHFEVLDDDENNA